MGDSFRGQYTLEFKQEAVRLVRGGDARPHGLTACVGHSKGKTAKRR